MGTLHSNSPREALSRIENMIQMAGLRIPDTAIKNQIAGSLDLIIQIQKQQDGSRRISSISEVTGIEGNTISIQELFKFQIEQVKNGIVKGDFVKSQVMVKCMEKFVRMGLDNQVKKIFQSK